MKRFLKTLYFYRVFSYTFNIEYKYIIKTHKFFYNQLLDQLQKQQNVILQDLS